MNLNYKYFLITGINFFIILSNIETIAQVTVLVQQPPPNRLLIEDLWKIKIINPTQNSFSVYLTASVNESITGQILNGETKNFNIPTGLKYVTSNDVGDVNVHYLNEEIKNIIKKTGSVPSGYYTICINVVKSDGSGMIIGSTCMTQDVNIYTQPIIISPNNKESVSDELPVFNWLPPTPVKANQNLTYTIKIVEIIQKQSPLDAMRSNPEWFILSNLNTPIYQFNFSSRSFVPGTRYAWKVMCYLNGFYINESVINEFTYITNQSVMKTPLKNKSTGDNNNLEYFEYTGKYNDSNSSLENIPQLENKNEAYIKSLIENLRLSKENDPFAGGNNMSNVSEQLVAKTPNILLSGSSRIYGQNSNRQGTDQLLPQKFARWEFNPSISIYKIPFSANLLLTTEQTDSKQNINNIGINFDPVSLIQDLKTKTINRILSGDNIKEYDMLKAQINEPGNVNMMNRLKELEKLNPMDSETAKEYNELKNKVAQLEMAKEKLKSIEKTKQDLDELKNTTDPQVALEKIRSYGEIPSNYNLLLSVRTFNVATFYPNYTNLTLSSIPLTGANLEINPGLLYFAVTGLKNDKAIQNSDSSQPVFARKIFSTRLGLGKYDGTHVYLTYLYGKDDPNSIRTDSTTTVTPMKDHLVGLETKISALSNILEFKGEITGSLYTRDITSPQIQNSSIPNFLKNTFGIQMSSSVDYAYLINGSLKLDKYGTRLTAGLNMTGPGYISLGSPNIRNDNFGIEVKLDQSLLQNQVTLSGYLRREKDNLISWKSSTTVNTLSTLALNLRFKNYPYLLIIISPNQQLNNQTADSLKVDNKTTLINFSTGYGANIQDVFAFTNLTYSQQSGKTLLSVGDYTTKNFLVFETISFRFPFNLTVGYNFTSTKIQTINEYINSYDLSASYTFFNKWQNTGGVDYSAETGNNRKIGFYYSTTIPMWTLGNLVLRIEKNVYKDNISTSNNYNEFILKATITNTW